MVSRTEKNKVKRKKIKSEEKTEKRKKRIIRALKIALYLSIFLVSLSLYTYYVSTRQLVVKEYPKKYDNLPTEFHGLKIVQFGELYYDQNYTDMLNKLKNTINNVKPDIVLFTGNLVSSKYDLKDSGRDKLIECLKDVNPKLDKYFVVGNNDNDESIDILKKSDFRLLDNTSDLIYYNSSTPIKISGVNTSYSNLENKEDYFHIVITNDPDNIDYIINKTNPDIVMAGKNLNSQVRIPYYGALFKTNNYIDSYYSINNTDVYITGGIGTNNYPIRLFNHPSINFYRLLSNK